MTSFRYRALTPNGEVVSGSIAASTAAEVAERVEYLGLIPIETDRDDGARPGTRWDFNILSRPRPEDVTIFTGDLALLLQTGARINEALELLSDDSDIGRLRPTVAKITAAILAGASFADAVAHHPGGARCRTGPGRGAAPALRRRLAISRLCLGRGKRRASLFPDFRAAAIWRDTARLQCQTRPDRARLPCAFGFLAGAHRGARGDDRRRHRRRLVFLAPSQGARYDHGSARAFAFHQPGFGFSSNLHLLPQPRCPPRERGPADSDAANTRRFDGHDGTRRRLEQDRRSRSPRRQAFRRSRQDRGDTGDGHPDLAARRRVGSTARACATHRGVLRSQASTQSRSAGRYRRPPGDRLHQHHCRRADRFGSDRSYVSQPSRRMNKD